MIYMDTCLEPMGTPWNSRHVDLAQRTNYHERERVLALKPKLATAASVPSATNGVGAAAALGVTALKAAAAVVSYSSAGKGKLSTTLQSASLGRKNVKVAQLGVLQPQELLGRGSLMRHSDHNGKVDGYRSGEHIKQCATRYEISTEPGGTPVIGGKGGSARGERGHCTQAAAAGSDAMGGEDCKAAVVTEEGGPHSAHITEALSPYGAAKHSNNACSATIVGPVVSPQGLPTAVVVHGANPGMVQHFVKAALWNMAEDCGMATGKKECSLL